MRLCPICNVSLAEKNLHGQVVDRCPKCNGIYFDNGELKSIIHLVDIFRTIEINEEDINSVEESESVRIMLCPADKSNMDKLEIAGLTIDVCPDCGGVWLDGGEITALKIAENHIRDNIELYIRLGE